MNKTLRILAQNALIMLLTSVFGSLVFAQQNLRIQEQRSQSSEIRDLDKLESESQSPFDAVKGKREDLSKRDAYSKHFINEDGSYTALIGAGPIHYEKDGQFLDIEYNIVPNSDATFSYANKANLFESYFGATAHSGVKNLTPNGEVKEFLNTKMYWEVNGQAVNIQNSANVAVSVSGDKAYYNNLYASISAEFTMEAGRRKLNYIIPNSQALGNVPQGAGHLVFSEDVELPTGWSYSVEDFGILIKDASGNVVYWYENPISRDASEELNRETNTLYSASLNGQMLTIHTKVASAWLLDSNRQFPIQVDPTVNVTPNNANNWTRTVASDGWDYAPLMFGRDDLGFWMRGFIRFNSSSIISGSTINSAIGWINIIDAFVAWNGPWQFGNGADPTTTNGLPLYNSANLGYSAIGSFNSGGWKSSTLFNPQGNTYIENQLSTGRILLSVIPAGTFLVNQHYVMANHTSNFRPYIAIDYTEPSACFPGTASGPAWVQTNNTANLTLSGHTGSSIQWQSSPNGTSGWTNVSTGSGGTTTSYTTAALANGTYYFRAQVSEGACTEFSNVVTINVAANPVYCSGAGSGNATLNNHIQSIGFHEWIDPTVGGTNNYVSANYLDYTDTTLYGYATVVAGQYHHLTALIRAQGSGGNSTTFAFWIDWNGDGVFTNTAFSSGGERMDNINYTSNVGNSYASYFTVPASSNGMVRVRMRAVRGNQGTLDPCFAYTQSQTKDFMVKILPNMGPQACNGVLGNANVVLTNATADKVNITRVKVDGPGGTVLDNQGQFFGIQVGATITMYNYSNFMGSFSEGLTFEAGQNYTIEVEHSGYTTACGLFIDWNNDGAFTGPNEAIQVISDDDMNPFVFNFTAPSTLVDGQEVIMRVRLQYEDFVGQAASMTACNNMVLGGLNIYSEVEDYRATLSACANPSVPPTSINSSQEMCFGGSTTLSISDGSLTDGAQWEWFAASCGSTPIGTGTSISVSPSTTTQYFVRASAGPSCSASACSSIEVSLPTISNALAVNGETATCYVNHNNWVHFYNNAGNLLASINSEGQDLGNVIMTAYVAGEPYQKPSCDALSSPAFTQTVMGRSFVITPQHQPANGTSVQVRLYINDGEFTAYQMAAANNDNPNDGAANLGAMDLSKVSGGANSGNPMDLCDEDNATVQYIEQSVGGSGPLAGLPNFTSFSDASYLDFTITGFSEFFLMTNTDNSALPVELTAFSANCQDDKIQISWSTASELNASHYILQSSRDGQTWLHLAEIEAAGTTNQRSNYSYNDQNFGALMYYRLVQVDNDGEQAVYGPISSNCNLENNLMTVHPNPASESFTVMLQSTENIESAQVDLVDLSGRVILSQQTTLNSGSTMLNFDVKAIQPGAYMIRVKGENDKFTPIHVVKL